ncbi:permease prefix domain 1-containing protein [Oscillospiraceae bacterium MB08-C2-2]|nr:permease prefix domain 1-containing protein [Oscillospiraceae bacterium MB08-C2-2]
MNEKIRSHVEYLFKDAPKTKKAFDLKEELITNMEERYRDLLEQGKEDEIAMSIVLAGIGDVEELISGLEEPDVAFDYTKAEAQQKKSALLIAVAVGIYIISLIFPMIGDYLNLNNLIFLPMFALWAFATGLLIYNALSRPKYVKRDATMVEEFKEWQVEKQGEKSLIRSIQSVVWSLTVIVYLVLGFFFFLWSPGWIVFLIAGVVNRIIKLVFEYRRR